MPQPGSGCSDVRSMGSQAWHFKRRETQLDGNERQARWRLQSGRLGLGARTCASSPFNVGIDALKGLESIGGTALRMFRTIDSCHLYRTPSVGCDKTLTDSRTGLCATPCSHLQPPCTRASTRSTRPTDATVGRRVTCFIFSKKWHSGIPRPVGLCGHTEGQMLRPQGPRSRVDFMEGIGAW